MIELRPNKDLLDANFNGYKLSLEPVPVYRHKLECCVDHVLPSDDQYSFLHLKVFGLHNHLYGDPWSGDDVYYIDKKWKVQRNISHINTKLLEGVKEVWEMPSNHIRQPGHYNTSLSFPSTDLAILSDGAGTLHIVRTGPRATEVQWQVVFSDEVCGKEKPFTIVHSRSCVVDGRVEIHCVLLHVDDANHKEAGDVSATGTFKTVLEWITLVEGETGSWSMQCVRQLSGQGGTNYVALELDCRALYVASDNPFEFVLGSEKSVKKELVNVMVQDVKPWYMWQQTADDVVLTFRVPEDTKRDEVEVCVEDDHLRVSCRGEILLEGDTYHRLDIALSTWIVEKGKLEVTLVKLESRLMWQELVSGDERGEEVQDPTRVEEIHQRLAHLCSDKEVKGSLGGYAPGLNSEQLEECDALPTSTAVLARLDSISHKASHQINLGGYQWLFSMNLNPETVPALCLRHDVDGCVWQPETPPDQTKDWPCIHVGTFLAFGYVQASKQQKKFSTCAPDMSYVAICEASRHIYIYRQPTAITGELRNRRTGQLVGQMAKQQLVNLDAGTEVLGVHASHQSLYVLTCDVLYALRINC